MRLALTALGVAFFAAFVGACGKDSAPKGSVTPSSVTNAPADEWAALPEWREKLALSNLDPLREKLLAAKATDPASLRQAALSAWGDLRTPAQFEAAYWQVLSAKALARWHDADFERTFAPLSNLAWVDAAQSALIDSTERLAETDLTKSLALLHGLRQFGLSGASEERHEVVLDRVWFADERASLKAMLRTNAVSAWFLPRAEKWRVKAYDIPLESLRKLYVYEQGGTSYEYFQYLRLSNLARIRQSFPPNERWIFTNIRWPDLSRSEKTRP